MQTPTHKPRRVKVAPHYQQRRWSIATTAQLRLQGNWLAAAGFPPGTVATIEVQAGRLIITPATI